MNAYSLSGLLIFITSSFFGLLVLIKGDKKSGKYAWSLFCASVAVYGGGSFFVGRATDSQAAILWWRIAHVGVIFIAVSFWHYVYNFLEINRKKTVYVVYAVGFMFLYIDLFTDRFIKTTRFLFNSIYYNSPPAELYTPFLVFWLAALVYSYLLLYSAYATTDETKKVQIKYFFAATFLGFAGGVTSFLPIYGIDIYPYFNFTVVFFPILMTYAIIRHQLMDIRLVARKYLVYSAYLITIALFFLLFKIVTYSFVSTAFADVIDLVLLITAILFTAPLKSFYYRLANQHFFSSLYDTEDVIEEITNQLHSTIDLQKICSGIHETLAKNFHLLSIAILRYHPNTKNFKLLFTHNIPLGKSTLPRDQFLYDHFLSYNETVIVEELKLMNEPRLKKSIEIFDELKIKVVVPLVVKNDVIGIMVLGPKESKDIYNDEDLRVLKIVASQAATAIENARLYAEVQEFGRTLQQKVDEQTREIKAKAEHLKKLMDMRSEFLDITSHQLRTPVSVIKGVLSMLEEGSIPKDREKDFIKGAMEKSIKLGEIINDILRASEMDSDKFTMTIREVDLNDMMKKINDDKIRSAEIKKLKFFMTIPELPIVMTDPKYVEHAIVNLINNSIQYTVEGSITVTAEVTNTHVIIRVTDTGIGIPPEAREKLFTKFARAANAVTTFTDGTGLGLFIIKQIVDANPGAKIEIERTEVNKGTTFAYWLPRAHVEGQEAPVEALPQTTTTK